MKKFTINTKRTYTKNGEEKALWSKVGELKVNDDGKQFIELFMFPNTSFYVFEDVPREEKKTTLDTLPTVQVDINDGSVDDSSIPF